MSKGSAQPCGCDPGAAWVCGWHTPIGKLAGEHDNRRTMASRENAGLDNPQVCLCNPRGSAANPRCPIHQGRTARGTVNADNPQASIGSGASSSVKFDDRASDGNIPGNGEQVGFSTGATRSSSADKIDYEGHISPVVLKLFGEYMHEHRVQRDGKVRASDNWQQGIPIYRYVKSLIRHTQEFWLMWRGEVAVNPDNGKPFTFKAVLCAILFNTMGILFEMARHKHNPLAMAYMTETARLELEGADKVKTETAPTPFAAFVNEVARKEDEALGGACCGQPATCKYPCSEGKQKQRIYDGTWPGGAGSFTFVPENARDAYRITITRQS